MPWVKNCGYVLFRGTPVARTGLRVVSLGRTHAVLWSNNFLTSFLVFFGVPPLYHKRARRAADIT